MCFYAICDLLGITGNRGRLRLEVCPRLPGSFTSVFPRFTVFTNAHPPLHTQWLTHDTCSHEVFLNWQPKTPSYDLLSRLFVLFGSYTILRFLNCERRYQHGTCLGFFSPSYDSVLSILSLKIKWKEFRDIVLKDLWCNNWTRGTENYQVL